MRILTYRHLDPTPVQASYDRVVQALSNGDLHTPNVKKLAGHPYYRAKLSDTHRLLLSFYQHQGETVCLLLDVILNHQYQKSRFLRGAQIKEDQIESGPTAELHAAAKNATELRYLHPARQVIHLLDKAVSFDDAQQQVYGLPLPLIVAGPAGSGKTVLTLERLREMPGRTAYVTLSPYLARQAEALYAAGGIGNPEELPAFLAFSEVLESLLVPEGREVTFPLFVAWLARQPAHRYQDAHALFEEFRGVLAGALNGPPSLDAYLALGVRQSLYPAEERAAVHGLFLKYRDWLKADQLYDPGLAAFSRLPLAAPVYDALVIDEVQDLTPVQLTLLTRLLKDPSGLLLCGDANQVVHPNFFSWAATRTLLRQERAATAEMALLSANYRNAREITRVANRLLQIRVARFGSIDRESNHLVQATTLQEGRVELLTPDPATLARLSEATRQNVNFAVIVLRDEDKARARATFRTPLVFSVHEAKGLEYQGVILYDLIGSHRQAYREIAADLPADALEGEELRFGRAADKHDKSGEGYKFYLNALYVALTRGIEQVILIEQDPGHPMVSLLDVADAGGRVNVETKVSSAQAWADEARRLQAQGKTEQAQAITRDILKLKPVPWDVMTGEAHRRLWVRVMNEENATDKERRAFIEYNVWHRQWFPIEMFAETTGYPAALDLTFDPDDAMDAYIQLMNKVLNEYVKRNFKSVLWDTDLYGVNHRSRLNATPLMLAAMAENTALVDELLRRDADPDYTDHFGHTAGMYALAQGVLFSDFQEGPLSALYDRLMPPHLDVQVEGKLIRLKRGQGEYAVLYLMLTCLKYVNFHAERTEGLTVDLLALTYLTDTALPELQLNTSQISRILARAEISSNYQPSRKLWGRMSHGHYLPNPDLLLRVKNEHGWSWTPLEDALDLKNLLLPPAYDHSFKPVGIYAVAPPRDETLPLPRTRTEPGMNTPSLQRAYKTAPTVDHVLETLLSVSGAGVDPEHWKEGPFRHHGPFVGRALRGLKEVRLAVPDDQGLLHGLVDDGAQVYVGGVLTVLSDAALCQLLAWQAWRTPEVLHGPALDELRRHNFNTVADELTSGEHMTLPAGLRVDPPAKWLHSADLADETEDDGPLEQFGVKDALIAPVRDAVLESLADDAFEPRSVVVTFNRDEHFFQLGYAEWNEEVYAEIFGPRSLPKRSGALSPAQRKVLNANDWMIDEGTKAKAGNQRRIFSLKKHALDDIIRHVAGMAFFLYGHDGQPLFVTVVGA